MIISLIRSNIILSTQILFLIIGTSMHSIAILSSLGVLMLVNIFDICNQSNKIL